MHLNFEAKIYKTYICYCSRIYLRSYLFHLFLSLDFAWFALIRWFLCKDCAPINLLFFFRRLLCTFDILKTVVYNETNHKYAIILPRIRSTFIGVQPIMTNHRIMKPWNIVCVCVCVPIYVSEDNQTRGG